MELIAQGAEAKIYRRENTIIKERSPKTYRVEVLDHKIRKSRTRQEQRILEKAAKIIHVPKVLDYSDTDMKITMEYIDGEQLSTWLKEHKQEVAETIGKQIALLHNNNIIHGDLTTSNMIYKEGKIYFIDFGLGFIDQKYEHKAVDLHLLEQALYAKHHEYAETFFVSIIEAYKKHADSAEQIIEQFTKVSHRGRYKSKKVKQ